MQRFSSSSFTTWKRAVRTQKWRSVEWEYQQAKKLIRRPNYGGGWRTMHHGNLREVNNKRHQLSTESNNIILIWPSKVTQDHRKCHGSTHRLWFPITVPWSYLVLFPTYSQILVENRETYISVFNSPVLSDPIGILQTWLVQNGRLEWFDYHRPEESIMMWTLRWCIDSKQL